MGSLSKPSTPWTYTGNTILTPTQPGASPLIWGGQEDGREEAGWRQLDSRERGAHAQGVPRGGWEAGGGLGSSRYAGSKPYSTGRQEQSKSVPPSGVTEIQVDPLGLLMLTLGKARSVPTDLLRFAQQMLSIATCSAYNTGWASLPVQLRTELCLLSYESSCGATEGEGALNPTSEASQSPPWMSVCLSFEQLCQPGQEGLLVAQRTVVQKHI